MAGKNQVTLTFAGDSTKLSKAFDDVGAASKRMSDTVGSSSKRVGDDTSSGFNKAGEAADNTYSKFDALESVGRGTGDTMSGLSEIMKGNVLQGSTDLAGGIAALADGFSGALLPAIKAVISGGVAQAAQTVRTTAVTVVQRGAMLAAAVAANVMAVAQRVLNAAMRANPIGLVITALVLLGTGLVLAYKKSETFRNIVNGAFNAVKSVASAVLSFFTGTLWPGIQRAWNGISSGIATAKDKIVGSFNAVISFAKSVPGKIGGFFKGIGSAVAAPFQAAFQAIKNAWNNTVGGKGFSVPGWVPGLGGKDFRIPYFHTGGIVPGGLGSETLAVLRAGERVTSGSNTATPDVHLGDIHIVVEMDGQQFDARIKSVQRDRDRELKRTVKAA